MSFSASVDELVERSTSPVVASYSSWIRIPLGQLVSILNGAPWKSEHFNDQQGVPLIRIRDVTTGSTSTRYAGPIDDAYWIEPGDILVGMDGDFNLRVWNSSRALLNQRVCKITPDERYLLRGYLAHILPGYLKLINDETHSVTVKHLSSKTIGEIPLPVPPVPEQRRIVAKLDSLRARSSRARHELDLVSELIERYKNAVLSAAFAGTLTPEIDRSFFKLSSLSEVISSTFYGPRIAKEAYIDRGIPTLRTTDITTWGRLSPKDPPHVAVSSDEFAKWSFEDGDLMVTRTGATIGKCATYEASMGPALPSAYLIRVRLSLLEADPRFVTLFLLSPDGQRQLLDGRTAVAQPNINAHAIASVQLPLPPVQHQRAIIRRVDAMFKWIDRLTAEATNAHRLIDNLDQAILAKAFRGELVPQDPNDEPASVLLERIKGERKGEDQPRRRRARSA